MNKKEIALLLALNKTNYPDSQYRNMTQLELSALIDNWYHHFKEFPAETVNAIFYECQKTSHFPIQIADIYDKLKLIKKVNSKSIEELWQEFVKAAKKVYDMSYYFRFDFAVYDTKKGSQTGWEIKQDALDYFNNLDPEIRRYAGDMRRLISFGEIDRSELEQIIQPSFRRCMEAARLKSDVLDSTSPCLIGAADRMMIGEGE